jgi:hypothetical protein
MCCTSFLFSLIADVVIYGRQLSAFLFSFCIHLCHDPLSVMVTPLQIKTRHILTAAGIYNVSLNMTNVGGSNVSTQWSYIATAVIPVVNFGDMQHPFLFPKRKFQKDNQLLLLDFF